MQRVSVFQVFPQPLYVLPIEIAVVDPTASHAHGRPWITGAGVQKYLVRARSALLLYYLICRISF